MKHVTITEATTAPAASDTPDRLLVGLITPGWGSSGYYSPKVVENAAADKVWPKGTHVYFDHPTESEQYDRPERSVRDLAAVLSEDARWDGNGLVAEADVIGPYKDLVTDPVFVEAVGMSIRAGAETTTGEADGRKGTIITRLTEGISVDLVTHAGRGGKVLAVLESARADLREATANDTNDALSAALKDANPGERVYTWVRDFDADKGLVYFVLDSDDESNTYQQGFTLADDGTATLTGDPIEVSVRTEYVPVTTDSAAAESGRTSVPAPAGQPENTPIPNVQEDTMGTIQVDEAKYATVTEAAGRVPTLEAERDTERQRADNAETELATFKAREAARPVVAQRVGESGLPARRQARIIESVLGGIAGDNTDPERVAAATEAAVTDAEADMAEIAEALGAGRVRGLGAPGTAADEVSEADFHAAMYGTEQKGA